GRRRFTIGHELGHFLIPTHTPGREGRFLCSMQHLLAMDKKAVDRRLRWEAEANRFASLILMPPPRFRVDANVGPDADLKQLLELARRYEVSNEACGGAYVDYRHEPVALLIVHE